MTDLMSCNRSGACLKSPDTAMSFCVCVCVFASFVQLNSGWKCYRLARTTSFMYVSFFLTLCLCTLNERPDWKLDSPSVWPRVETQLDKWKEAKRYTKWSYPIFSSNFGRLGSMYISSDIKVKAQKKRKRWRICFVFLYFLYSNLVGYYAVWSTQKRKKIFVSIIHSIAFFPLFFFPIEICCENKGKSKRTGQIRWINSPNGCIVKCPATCFYAFGRTKLN